MLFTEEELIAFSPKARPELRTALLQNQTLLRNAGLDQPLRLWHFFSQVATETAGMTVVSENMTYTEKRLLEVFSRKTISVDKAKELGCKKGGDRNVCSRAIANWVYGERLDNRGRHTNDGWDYRGSGYIQLTGRGNFRSRGLEIGRPLEANPELARRPNEGLQAAVAFWTARAVNKVADRDDARLVRIKVNGKAAHALPQARAWLRRARGAFRTIARGFPDANNPPLEGGNCPLTPQEVLDVLSEAGAIGPQFAESGSAGQISAENVLNTFQEEAGLPPTDFCSIDLLYQLSSPDLIAKEDDLASDGREGSATASFRAITESSHFLPDPNTGTGLAISADKELSSDEVDTLALAVHAFPDYAVAFGNHLQSGLFAEYAVIDGDDRVEVKETTEYPARAIVQIQFENGLTGELNLCSGAMISADTVLTAGHCVHTGGENGAWHRDIKVYPGRSQTEKPFGTCNAVAGYALTGWTELNPASLDASKYDLGAVKLDCRVGERTGWLPVASIEDDAVGRPTVIEGYAAEKSPWGAQFLSRDQVRAVDSDGLKLFYRNDTEGGTSGSPVFSESDFSIFCIHTNGLLPKSHGPWGTNNSCTRITPTRRATISNWVAGSKT